MGYYEPFTKWPSLINGALRMMGYRLFDLINLQPGPVVLSAGCAVGRVAMYMARKGLRVGGIDVVSNHVKWARQELQAHGLEDAITIRFVGMTQLMGVT